MKDVCIAGRLCSHKNLHTLLRKILELPKTRNSTITLVKPEKVESIFWRFV